MKDVPKDKHQDLDFIIEQLDWDKNVDTHFKDSNYLEPIVDKSRSGEGYTDRWIVYAKRLCKLTPAGRVVFDYDPRIAEPFRIPGGETGFDLWQAFAGLNGVPSLVLRGELSDLLSAETVERMLAANSAMEAATVPRVGHAPTLDEPEAEAAIDRLLKRVRSRRKPSS